MNVDMMKEKIYNALRIGERRQAYWDSRRKGTGYGTTDGQRPTGPATDPLDPEDPFGES